jgi:hypothetical protein
MKKYAIIILTASALAAGCNQSVQRASEKFNELPPSDTTRVLSVGSRLMSTAGSISVSG